MIITIDGPAGSGKTTVARALAKRLGIMYFDTGAMYRAATYFILKEGISLNDKKRLAQFLKKFSFHIHGEGKNIRYFSKGEDITQTIRSQEVTTAVSEVAASPLVREALVAIQREYGKQGDAVFEGRDMGTVVFPHATVKIYLTASEEVSATRRFKEIEAQGKEKVKEEEVLKKMRERNIFDSQREHSPLRKAEDAYEIDTSDLSIEEVVEKIISLIP